jgi:hypothetical protein
MGPAGATPRDLTGSRKLVRRWAFPPAATVARVAKIGPETGFARGIGGCRARRSAYEPETARIVRIFRHAQSSRHGQPLQPHWSFIRCFVAPRGASNRRISACQDFRIAAKVLPQFRASPDR